MEDEITPPIWQSSVDEVEVEDCIHDKKSETLPKLRISLPKCTSSPTSPPASPRPSRRKQKTPNVLEDVKVGIETPSSQLRWRSPRLETMRQQRVPNAEEKASLPNLLSKINLKSVISLDMFCRLPESTQLALAKLLPTLDVVSNSFTKLLTSHTKRLCESQPHMPSLHPSALNNVFLNKAIRDFKLRKEYLSDICSSVAGTRSRSSSPRKAKSNTSPAAASHSSVHSEVHTCSSVSGPNQNDPADVSPPRKRLASTKCSPSSNSQYSDDASSHLIRSSVHDSPLRMDAMDSTSPSLSFVASGTGDFGDGSGTPSSLSPPRGGVMPPPRQTKTLASIREKLRAKRLMKESQRGANSADSVDSPTSAGSAPLHSPPPSPVAVLSVPATVSSTPGTYSNPSLCLLIPAVCSPTTATVTAVLAGSPTALMSPCSSEAPIPPQLMCKLKPANLSLAAPILSSAGFTTVCDSLPLKSSAAAQSQPLTMPSQTRAFFVDGNNLSETVALLQSMNPQAKVTQQQFLLIPGANKSQVILCRSPPAQSTPPSLAALPFTSPNNGHKSPMPQLKMTNGIGGHAAQSAAHPIKHNVPLQPKPSTACAQTPATPMTAASGTARTVASSASTPLPAKSNGPARSGKPEIAPSTTHARRLVPKLQPAVETPIGQAPNLVMKTVQPMVRPLLSNGNVMRAGHTAILPAPPPAMSPLPQLHHQPQLLPTLSPSPHNRHTNQTLITATASSLETRATNSHVANLILSAPVQPTLCEERNRLE